MGNKPWPDDDINQLVTLWSEGKTAAKIAKEITKKSQRRYSRNSVAGMVERLRKKPQYAGLLLERDNAKPHRKPVVKAGCSNRRVAPRSKKELKDGALPNIKADKIYTKTNKRDLEIEGIGFHDLEPTTCRWPIGDVGADDFRFCGAQCSTEKPYCSEHSIRAYAGQAVTKRATKIAGNIARKAMA